MVSPIISILSNDKLIGENYVKWKNNINAVLVCEDLKFVLMEEYPPELAKNASQAVHDAHQKWVKANEKARCYLLAETSKVLAVKHEPMAIAYEMLQSLQGMF